MVKDTQSLIKVSGVVPVISSHWAGVVPPARGHEMLEDASQTRQDLCELFYGFSNRWCYKAIVRWVCPLQNRWGPGRSCSWGQGSSWWWVYEIFSCGAPEWQWDWSWPYSPGSSLLHLCSLAGPARQRGKPGYQVHSRQHVCFNTCALIHLFWFHLVKTSMITDTWITAT